MAEGALRLNPGKDKGGMNPNPSGEPPAPPSALRRQPKTLGEMSFAELSEELAAAQAQYRAASFQEQLRVMQSQQDAAIARKAAVEAEIDRRFAGVKAAPAAAAGGRDGG